MSRLRLHPPQQEYDQRSETERNKALELADAQNQKRDSDIDVHGRSFKLASPNGTRYTLTVSDAGGLYLTNESTQAVREFWAMEMGDGVPTSVADETVYFNTPQ